MVRCCGNCYWFKHFTGSNMGECDNAEAEAFNMHRYLDTFACCAFAEYGEALCCDTCRHATPASQKQLQYGIACWCNKNAIPEIILKREAHKGCGAWGEKDD